jgi:predicted nucleic acid-binding protein
LKLIIDERKGRKIALNEEIQIVGVLGILIANYRQKLISFDEALYNFELFKKNGLRVSSELEKLFIKKLGEINL